MKKKKKNSYKDKTVTLPTLMMINCLYSPNYGSTATVTGKRKPTVDNPHTKGKE